MLISFSEAVREVVIILICVIAVICGWISYAARPTNEAGTQAVLEKQAEWNEMAKKYPYKGE